MWPMRAPISLSTSLDDLQPGDRALVLEVCPPPQHAGWTPWLTALGFEPGEPLRLMSRAQPGGDPLRRAEAACIRVRRELSA